MTRFFTRERFGRPQFLAGLLLVAFLAQASWLVHSELSASKAPGLSEDVRIDAGWLQLHGARIAGAPFPDISFGLPLEFSQSDGYDTEHSPLLYLVTAAPLLASPQTSAQSRIFPALALAPAPTFPGLRSSPRRIPLVRSPSSLRQHRRIPRPNPLLFFPLHDPGQRRLAHRA